MDTMTGKTYQRYGYRSRYDGIPEYYDEIEGREVSGVGRQCKKDASCLTIKTRPGDNLDALALKYYANPTLWWAIAYFNDIEDALEPLYPKYRTLRIPSLSGFSWEGD